MANSGLPSALLGQVVHNIEYQPAVECYRFAFSHDPPLNFRAGFAGSIGISVGQAAHMVRLTFAATAERSQFDFLARIAIQRSGGRGFTYDWWEGLPGLSNHWMITGCFIGSFSMSNDPAQGVSDKEITIMGSGLTKIA